jgi:hypothetical protein
MQCKLCKNNFPKLSDAHIIPRCMYGDNLNDPSGPMRIMSNRPDEDRAKRSRIGEYDAALLCDKCESDFSKYDDYACKLFFEHTYKPCFFESGEAHADQYDQYDREKLRMFFISLIWRMDRTTRPAFSAVKVRGIIKILEKALIQKTSLCALEIDVVVSRFVSAHTQAILFPTRLRIHGVNGYRVCFANHMCWVKVDQRKFPSPFDEMSISSDGPLIVLRRNFENSPEMRALTRIVKASKNSGL